MNKRLFLIVMLALCSCVVLLGPTAAHAQRQSRDYLQGCDNQSNTCKNGLICVTGICVHTCDAVQNQCPQKEPCKIQTNGQGACICTSHADCPSGTVCNKGQCAGNGRIGDLCDTSTPCGRGLLCAKPVDAKDERCLAICTGVSCNNGQSPCVSISGTPFGVCYCNESSHCTVGVCINGTCKLNAGRGEECTQRTPCRSGLTCVFEPNAKSGRCHPPCNSARDCFGGEQCITKGGRRVCACEPANPCLAGTCRAGFCDAYQRCDKDTPCPSDKVCFLPIAGRTEGICLDSCSTNKDCSGNTPCLPLSASSKRACYCTTDNNCGTKGDECRNYRCNATCVLHSQCPLDKICKNNYCVTPTAEDPIPEREPQEPVPETDAGTPKPRPDVKPPCNPVCEKPLVCNPKTGKCQKLGIGDFCDKDADCESGLCFGPAFPKPSICSLADCSKCADFALECQTHGGKKACYRKAVTNPPPTPPKSTCGCQAGSQSPPWLWCVLLALCAFVTTRRKAR